VQPGGAQVVDALRAMDVRHCLGGLQFHDHRFFDQQVDRVFTNNDPVLDDDNAALLYDREAGFAKLVRARIFLNLFKESRSKSIGDSHRASDDSLRQPIPPRFICVHLRSSAAEYSLLPLHPQLAEELTASSDHPRASAALGVAPVSGSPLDCLPCGGQVLHPNTNGC
jgi:hypothetical protein